MLLEDLEPKGLAHFARHEAVLRNEMVEAFLKQIYVVRTARNILFIYFL